jgi:ATP-dependent Clp protease ATP-binding subunit ClpB
MRIDRLTNQLQVALSDAQSIALGQDHSQLDPGHLLLAMIDQRRRQCAHVVEPGRF